MIRREPGKDETHIDYNEIDFTKEASGKKKKLGAGGFGVVYHGTWRHNEAAIKQLLMKQISPEAEKEFQTEAQVMARLRSPNIVQFYGYSMAPERCIVMEYCPNGSLFSVLRSDKPLDWSVRVNIALGAAKGVAFLHDEKILHRDIKSLNILLTRDFEAKVTDFGLSKIKAETRSHAAATKTGKAVGTLQWMAPELFNPEGVYTWKSDTYSLGVTFWELSSRKIPFENAANPMLVPVWIGQGKREEIQKDCPPSFGSLIQQCWTGEPSKRPDNKDIITQLKKTLEELLSPKVSNISNLYSPKAVPQNFKLSPNPLVFSLPQKALANNNIYPQPVIPSEKIQATPKAVAAFVKLVAEGEQDQAEAMLQKDATLALFSSDMTDLSGRTFKDITGFQFSIWALDWHMWTMILKYLPTDKAAEQIKVIDKGPWVSQHRKSGDWLVGNLLNALQTQINLINQSKYSEARIQWETKVGGAQRLLPVHVINEYCHSKRPFDPCPDFTQSDLLPRTRETDNGEWFTASYDGGKLGETFGVYRGELAVFSGWVGLAPWPIIDHRACHTLLETRAQQRDLLIVRLLNPAFEGFHQPLALPSSNFPLPQYQSQPYQYPMLLQQPQTSQLAVFTPPLQPIFAARLPQPLMFSPQQNLRAEAAATFLKLIAEGEQDQAEALLQKDATLALFSSEVTDLSGRTFKGITGFQFSIWALDWHMWTMILKYLPTDKAAEQIKAMDIGSWVPQHRKSGDWLIQNLLDALQKYIDLYEACLWDKAEAQWQKQVGGAQRLLPVHVINEYCHPNRRFDPCPDFTQSGPLPRTRNIEEGEWFTAVYNGGLLGEKFAVLRDCFAAVARSRGRAGVKVRSSVRQDHFAGHTLLVTRVQQRDGLIAELSTAPTLKKQAIPQAVAAFLKLVAEGEQDQAEALLQKDATLALLPGDVTDLSGRTFKGITGFQYAIWALDWHMWTMILKYLPKDQAAEQIKAMDKGSWVSQHHKSGDWLIQNLIDALQTQINLLEQSKWDEAEIQWQTKAGGAQRLLPVHVINEYCHPIRPFYPCPDFTKPEPLPRTRKVREGEWFTVSYHGGKLGTTFGVYRGALDSAILIALGARGSERSADEERRAGQTLLVTRTQQRNQLFEDLSIEPLSANRSNNCNIQ